MARKTRKIVSIDEDKCNGCGNCITACAEGALALVDGKAKIVKEMFCDGFGDCIGECPTGALKIEDRESEEFDEEATKEHIRSTEGEDAVKRMEATAQVHEGGEHPVHPPAGGCPGSKMRFVAKDKAKSAASAGAGQLIESELQQWPVQIHLVQPGAPYFKGRELAVLSTCAPVANAEIHQRFIRGRGVAVGCPKLDDAETYAEKLGAILEDSSIPRVIIVRMEVPCCGGLTAIVAEAVKLSGRTDLEVEEITVGVDGTIHGAMKI